MAGDVELNPGPNVLKSYLKWVLNMNDMVDEISLFVNEYNIHLLHCLGNMVKSARFQSSFVYSRL